MKVRRIAGNVTGFDADGIAESLASVSSDRLRGGGWSEELIGYVERYRRGSAALQQYEPKVAGETREVPDEPSGGAVRGKV